MSIIDESKSLKTVNDAVRTDEMLERMVNEPLGRQRDMWIRDGVVGDVCMYLDNRYPENMIECVMGGAESSVTTLFLKHPAFASRERVTALRKELITEIGVATMSLPSNIAIRDEGRGRDVYLKEMSTAQLIDILEMAKNGKFGV